MNFSGREFSRRHGIAVVGYRRHGIPCGRRRRVASWDVSVVGFIRRGMCPSWGIVGFIRRELIRRGIDEARNKKIYLF